MKFDVPKPPEPLGLPNGVLSPGPPPAPAAPDGGRYVFSSLAAQQTATNNDNIN